MLTPDEIRILDKLFPVFRQLSEKDRQTVFSAGHIAALPDGQMLMKQDGECRFVPMVISGILRVYKLSPNGREMTLYRIGAGDTCIISIACQIREEDFPALAEVQGESQIFMLPSYVFREVLMKNPDWKDFLISSLYGHLTEVMQTLEAVAFDRTDRRLAAWLLEKSRGGTVPVTCTHEDIAVELGTAREVVSRLLGSLKSRGAVTMSRGKVKVVSAVLLRKLAEE